MDSHYTILCVFVLYLHLWKQLLDVSAHMPPRAEFLPDDTPVGFFGARSTGDAYIQVPDKGDLKVLPQEIVEMTQDEHIIEGSQVISGYSGHKTKEHYGGHRTRGVRKLHVLAADDNTLAKNVMLEIDQKLQTARTSLEGGLSNAKLLSQDDVHDNTTSSGEHSTDVSGSTPPPPPPPPPPSPPPPPPPPAAGETENTMPTTKNTTKANELPPDKEESNQKPKESSTHSDCGGSHCEDPKKLVSACLRIPGDGALELSLLITYDGASTVMVKVVAPYFLVADHSEISISSGKSETIQFTIDSKSKPDLMETETLENKMITITTIHGDCQISIPVDYLRSSMQLPKPQRSPLVSLVTPTVLLYLLVFVLALALVGACLCLKLCRKKRPGDALKYQQLEMSVPGQGTPKGRAEESADGWDEDWDDDWEDAEAAKTSSRLSHNLSARGRRGNKDGWDNSWED